MLRVIVGVRRVNGRPTISNENLYKQLRLLNLTSVYKYSLFKILKQLLDGKLPELWNILMSEYETPHTYNTRQIRMRHPALVCEIERRAMSHQLILLYESLPRDILDNNYITALKKFKNILLNSQ